MIVAARSPAERGFLVNWLANQLSVTPAGLVGDMPYEVLSSIRKDGALLGAVLYFNYRNGHIEMSCAGTPGWLNRGDLHTLFAYPFNQLGCWTLLTGVRRTDMAVRKFNERLGFRELCVIPGGPHKSDDTVLFAMRRTECPWLRKEKMQ